MKEIDEKGPMLKVKDLQEIFDIGRQQAYVLAGKDHFPSIRVGRSIRIPSHALNMWVQNQMTESERGIFEMESTTEQGSNEEV